MRVALLFCLLAALGASFTASASGPFERLWEGPGVIVSSFDLQAQQITVLDSGAVVCRSSATAAGSGGNCVPFGAVSGTNNALAVTEDCSNACVPNVLTFQVCVDNNGDGICKGLQDISDDRPMSQPPNCSFDSIFYSHSTTTTRNRDPLYIPAWAQTFWQGCGGVGYPGYVVIVCAGAHNNKAGSLPHTHTATLGNIAPASTTDLTSGNYCGAPTATKAYKVV